MDFSLATVPGGGRERFAARRMEPGTHPDLSAWPELHQELAALDIETPTPGRAPASCGPLEAENRNVLEVMVERASCSVRGGAYGSNGQALWAITAKDREPKVRPVLSGELRLLHGTIPMMPATAIAAKRNHWGSSAWRRLLLTTSTSPPHHEGDRE